MFMILAPNLRQLLSGNKVILFVLVPILLVSCGAFTKLIHDEPEEPVVIIADTTTAPVIDTFVEVPKEDDVDELYEYVEFKGQQYKVPVHKKDFTIALLLPFHVGYKNPQERLRAELMLEYYQGVLCALEKVAELGSKYRLQVFDTKNDSLVLKQILRRTDMKNVDMIIGPTDQKQVRIAAYFARKYEIPLFSPVTVIEDAIVQNAYLYNLNPSDQMKAKEFMSFYKAKHPNKKLVLIRDGGRFDKGFGEALFQLLQDESPESYQVVSSGRSGNWSDVLSSSQNLVVLTSENKTEVSRLITSLMPHAKKITLVGTQKWLDFTSMDYSFYHQLKVHFITSSLTNVTSRNTLEMQKIFRTKYNGDPSDFSYMGYDQFLFACELLNAFGEHFPIFITNKAFTYSGTRFKLVMANHCYHNQFMQIYAFQEKELIEVPMH